MYGSDKDCVYTYKVNIAYNEICPLNYYRQKVTFPWSHPLQLSARFWKCRVTWRRKTNKFFEFCEAFLLSLSPSLYIYIYICIIIKSHSQHGFPWLSLHPFPSSIAPSYIQCPHSNDVSSCWLPKLLRSCVGVHWRTSLMSWSLAFL